MEEMYKMRKLLELLLYAISVIDTEPNILKYCKAVSTVSDNRLGDIIYIMSACCFGGMRYGTRTPIKQASNI